MRYSDPIEYYQAIASELAKAIKEPWTSVKVEALLFESSVDHQVVYLRPDGSEESRVRTEMMADYFYELARVVSTKEKGLFKKCLFTLSSDGQFDVDFEY